MSMVNRLFDKDEGESNDVDENSKCIVHHDTCFLTLILRSSDVKFVKKSYRRVFQSVLGESEISNRTE